MSLYSWAPLNTLKVNRFVEATIANYILWQKFSIETFKRHRPWKLLSLVKQFLMKVFQLFFSKDFKRNQKLKWSLQVSSWNWFSDELKPTRLQAAVKE